jgi:putative membrane protein
LAGIAQREDLSAELPRYRATHTLLQAMNAQSGHEFDVNYVKDMLAAHDKAVALFKQASSASDPDIAAFASKTFPTLEAHRAMVANLASRAPRQ